MVLRLAAAVLLTAAASVTDRQTRVLPLPTGRALHLEITVGQVQIRGESRQDAVIEITRTAPAREGLVRIPLVVNETSDVVRVSAVQQGGGTDAAYRTDIVARVPHHAQVPTVHILEGDLQLTGLAGTVSAVVRRGSIRAADLRGTVRLETEIGDIDAARLRLTPDGLLRLRTFNGHIRLALAERPADARILALALNGTIRSEIPLRHRDAWGPRWAEATLGRGEPVISLDAVTGDIVIRSP